MSRHRVPGTNLEIVFGDGTLVVRPVELSPVQWSILREASAAFRLGHRSYVVPQKKIHQRAAALLLKMGLVKSSTRYGAKSVAITEFGKRILGEADAPPKLKVLRGGKP